MVLSVLAQTMVDWELIVVENGSTDKGPEIVQQFTDGRIRLFVSDKLGPGAARNHGLSHATGQWVLFLDADDLIAPDHLDNLMTGSKIHDSGVVAGGWKEFFGADPGQNQIHRPATYGFAHHKLLARAIALAPWILHAAIIKRELLVGQNLWPEQLDSFPDEDTAFWFAVLLDSRVSWIENYGAIYRRFFANSRSQSGEGMSRTIGYSKIIEHNMALARSRGCQIDPECFGVISMMFEVSYRKAVLNHDLPARNYALEQARYWLNHCPATDWNTRLRKWFGIPAVNCIKRILRRN
jgi:glycosyltransferase involved in cell wall biosynthesis